MGAAAVHPTDQTLQAYALGKLEDASVEPVSAHVESCPDCGRRVSEMSSDSFLGRLRNAQGSSPMSATDRAPVDHPNAGRGPAVAIAQPPAGTMPPGLADHPGYEVIRELGRGGMGVVYLVRNKLMERMEVLKVVGGHLVERPGVRDRFLREVQAAAKLQHKNIVTAYSAMQLGDSIVLAMEYVHGDDLAKIVKSSGPMPVMNACYFIYQAALGLQHAHERGMVHRDIKPANLILALEGKKAVVKVLDFGLAKVTSEGQADSGLTREGQMLGTPDYVAPEQIRNAQSADIRADIYSLGCTFYYLLTGGPPFRGDHLWDVYQAHFSMDAGPLNLVRPEVPVELATLVAKMMAKEPARRFQTPGDVAQALTPFFKKANSASNRSKLESFQDSRASDDRPVPAAVRTPAQPVTDNPRPMVPAKKAAEPTVAETPWETLLELENTKRLTAAAPVIARSSRTSPPWVWPAVAAAAFLGLAVALGVIFKFRTEDGGLLIVEVSEPGAEVTVDNRQVAITWDASRKRAEIKALPGDHMVQVTKDGFTAQGMKVAVSEAGREIVKAVLQPAEREVTKVDSKSVAPGDNHQPARIAIRDVAKADSKSVAPNVPAVPVTTPPVQTLTTKTYPAHVWWGVWGISGNDVVNRRTGSHSMVLLTGRNINLEEFTFEAEVRRIEGTGGVELHAGGEEYVTLGFHGKDNHLRVYLHNYKKGIEQKSPAPQQLDLFDADNWNHLRIEKKGDTVVCYVNHKELFREPNDQIGRGFLSLATVGANAKFRNIKATGPGGRVLAEGLPNLPKMDE